MTAKLILMRHILGLVWWRCAPQMLKFFENLTLNGTVWWWAIFGTKTLKKWGMYVQNTFYGHLIFLGQTFMIPLLIVWKEKFFDPFTSNQNFDHPPFCPAPHQSNYKCSLSRSVDSSAKSFEINTSPCTTVLQDFLFYQVSQYKIFKLKFLADPPCKKWECHFNLYL